jgi:hypothetical protein
MASDEEIKAAGRALAASFKTSSYEAAAAALEAAELARKSDVRNALWRSYSAGQPGAPVSEGAATWPPTSLPEVGDVIESRALNGKPQKLICVAVGSATPAKRKRGKRKGVK